MTRFSMLCAAERLMKNDMWLAHTLLFNDSVFDDGRNSRCIGVVLYEQCCFDVIVGRNRVAITWLG